MTNLSASRDTLACAVEGLSAGSAIALLLPEQPVKKIANEKRIATNFNIFMEFSIRLKIVNGCNECLSCVDFDIRKYWTCFPIDRIVLHQTKILRNFLYQCFRFCLNEPHVDLFS